MHLRVFGIYGSHNNIAGLFILLLEVLGKFSQQNFIDAKTEITTSPKYSFIQLRVKATTAIHLYSTQQVCL